MDVLNQSVCFNLGLKLIENSLMHKIICKTSKDNLHSISICAHTYTHNHTCLIDSIPTGKQGLGAIASLKSFARFESLLSYGYEFIKSNNHDVVA